MAVWQVVALLGFVILVYAWVFMRKKDADDYAAVMSDVEDTLEHFAAEAEARNEKLIAHIARLKEDHQAQMQKLSARVERLEERTDVLVASLGAFATGQADPEDHEMEQMGQADAQPQPAELISHRYGELIKLKKQGRTIDEIVKQTGMNHGEVELILQLASREETNVQ